MPDSPTTEEPLAVVLRHVWTDVSLCPPELEK